MKFSVADVVTALAIPVIAALGGALAVFSEIDDAPGGVLIGILLVVAAGALALRVVRRAR